MEDNKIIDLYWQRDENAIEETQKKYDGYCYSIAYHILFNSEDSRECVSDTYLGAWNAIPPARPSVLRTFIGRITRNLALKIVRHYSAEKRGGGEYDVALEEIMETLSTPSNVDQRIEEEAMSEAINGFLAGLGVEERRVFLCRYWYFDSIEEICERFGFGSSKVKMMLKRTRDRSKEHLNKEGIEI